MPTLRFAFVLALAAAFLSTPACAAAPCTPQVEDGWLRLPPGRMPMLAGFARIENRCAVPITVVAVESDAFGDVSLHETRLKNGISRMRPVVSLPVAPHARAELKPGGLHLMLMQPRSTPKVGDTVAVRFVLEDGRRVPGRFVIRPVGG